jgi:hypothetical protein
VSFDGIDDNLISDLRRTSATISLFIAFRPSWARKDGATSCPSGAAPVTGRADGHECVAGWPVSDNDLSSSPRSGFGIHVALDGSAQAVIGERSGLVAGNPLIESTFYIVSLQTKTNSAKMWINSKLSLDVGPGLSLNASAGSVRLTLGARGTHGSGAASATSVQEHFAGDIAEVVYFPRELPDDERKRVERSLISRWGQNWADPPVFGGNFAILTNPKDSIIYESSKTPLMVEIARHDASDGFVNMHYRVVAGDAVEGVNYVLGDGMNNTGELKWNHGDSSSRWITIMPMPDHLGLYDKKDLRVELTMIFSENMALVRTPSKQVWIKNSDPGVSQVIGASGPASGGTVVTLLGENFQRDDLFVEKKIDEFTTVMEKVEIGYQISVGGTACDQTKWVSETSLTCIVAAGVGAASDIAVTVQGNYSTVPRAFSYDKATVTAMQPTGVTYSTAGGPMITLYGSGFGSKDLGQQVVVGGITPCQTSLYVSDTEMHCSIPQGVGQNLAVGVAHVFSDPIRRQIGEKANSINYEVPVISLAAPESLLNQTGTLPVVNVSGSSFGLQDYGLVVTVGSVPCTSTTWVSDSSALCRVPPGAGMQPFGASVRSVNAVVLPSTKPFVYLKPPTVIGIAGSTYRGAPSITVVGSRFGTSETSVQVRIGPTMSSMAHWLSDTSILCSVPVGGVGTNHDIVVDVYSQRGTAAGAFAYESPLVTRASVDRVPGEGGVFVIFNGTGFGLPGDSLEISIGRNPCIVATRISSTSIG